jgi:hypothetical protein
MDLRTDIINNIHNTKCSRMRNTLARAKGTLTLKPPPKPIQIIEELASNEEFASKDESKYLTRFNHLNEAAMRMQGRTDTCQQISFAKYYFLNYLSDRGIYDLGIIYGNLMADVLDNNYSKVIDQLDDLDKAVLLKSFDLNFYIPENNQDLIEEFNNKFANYMLKSLNNNNKWESVILNLFEHFPDVYPISNVVNIKEIIRDVIQNLNDAMMKKRDYLVQLTQRLSNGYMLSPNEINEHRDAENKLHDRKPLTPQEKMQLIIKTFQKDSIYTDLLERYKEEQFSFPDPMNTRKVMTPVIKPENGWWLPKFSSTGGKKRKTNKRKKKKSQTKKNKRRVKKKSKSRKNRR